MLEKINRALRETATAGIDPGMTALCAPLSGSGPCSDARDYLCQVAQAAFVLLFHEPPGQDEVLRFLQATVKHFCNSFELDGMGEFILVTGGELDAVMSIWIAAEIRDMAEAKRSVDFEALQFNARNLGCVEDNV